MASQLFVLRKLICLEYFAKQGFSANLQGADLEKANLEGSCLAGADIQGAYLIAANLRRVDLR